MITLIFYHCVQIYQTNYQESRYAMHYIEQLCVLYSCHVNTIFKNVKKYGMTNCLSIVF